MRWLLLALAIAVAVVVGASFGWRFVFAPLVAWLLFQWALGTLRSMVSDGRAHVDADEQGPRPVTGPERTLYWCEECGTELVLLVVGSGMPPRHCGTRMHERVELLNG